MEGENKQEPIKAKLSFQNVCIVIMNIAITIGLGMIFWNGFYSDAFNTQWLNIFICVCFSIFIGTRVGFPLKK